MTNILKAKAPEAPEKKEEGVLICRSTIIAGVDYTQLFKKLVGSIMTGCKFTYCDFTGMQFEDVDFSCASFKNCLFEGCGFISCDFESSDFENCCLQEASFSESLVGKTIFNECDMTDVSGLDLGLMESPILRDCIVNPLLTNNIPSPISLVKKFQDVHCRDEAVQLAESHAWWAKNRKTPNLSGTRQIQDKGTSTSDSSGVTILKNVHKGATAFFSKSGYFS